VKLMDISKEGYYRLGTKKESFKRIVKATLQYMGLFARNARKVRGSSRQVDREKEQGNASIAEARSREKNGYPIVSRGRKSLDYLLLVKRSTPPLMRGKKEASCVRKKRKRTSPTR